MLPGLPRDMWHVARSMCHVECSMRHVARSMRYVACDTQHATRRSPRTLQHLCGRSESIVNSCDFYDSKIVLHL